MGNRYTVEAGVGVKSSVWFGTEYLVVALLKLWSIKIDGKTVYWKKLTIRE